MTAILPAHTGGSPERATPDPFAISEFAPASEAAPLPPQLPIDYRLISQQLKEGVERPEILDAAGYNFFPHHWPTRGERPVTRVISSHPAVSLKRGDPHYLGDERFALVNSSLDAIRGLGNPSERQAALVGLYRVLRPGGSLVVATTRRRPGFETDVMAIPGVAAGPMRPLPRPGESPRQWPAPFVAVIKKPHDETGTHVPFAAVHDAVERWAITEPPAVHRTAQAVRRLTRSGLQAARRENSQDA